MPPDITGETLTSDLAHSLRRFGINVSTEAAYNSAYLKVQVGRDTVALVADATDAAESAAGRLLERGAEKYVVAVRCGSDSFGNGSVKGRRYAWSVIQRNGTASDWMTGGIADFTLTIVLLPVGPREPSAVSRAFVEDLMECNAGMVVKVLPLWVATSHSQFELRQLLAEAFEVEFIFASHDTKRAGFSAHGKIPEVLLVCRARQGSSEKASTTRVVNISTNPSTAEDACRLASEIRGCIEGGGEQTQEFGSIQGARLAELAGGDWGAVQFTSPFLREQFLELKCGDMFDSIELRGIAKLGRTGRSIREVFINDSRRGCRIWKHKVLWGHNNEKLLSMWAEPDSPIWIKPRKSLEAEKRWDDAGRFSIATGAYLSGVRVVAARLDEPTLGSLWTNCRIRVPDNEQALYEKALCVYLNSTVGVLAILGGFTRGESIMRQRPTKDELRSLTVPNFDCHGDALNNLAATFDELGKQELLPLSQLDTCPTRQAIDTSVCDALGISEELIRSIRQLIAAEPSVAHEGNEGRESPRADNFHQMSFLPRV